MSSLGGRKRTIEALLVVSFLAGGNVPAWAVAEDPPPAPSPSATPTPEPPEIKRLREQAERLNLEKQIAESEKAIAEAKKARLSAEFPGQDVKALEGKTTVDDKATQEPTTIAYVAMKAVAQGIAREIRAKVNEPVRIVIHDAEQVAAAAEYRTFTAQTQYFLDQFDANLKDAEPSPEAGGVTPLAEASAALRGVIDVISLFRTDVDIKGVDVPIEESAFVASLAAAGAPLGLHVLYPRIYPLDAASFVDVHQTVTIHRLDELADRKKKAAAVFGRLDQLKAKVAELKAEKTEAEKAVKAAKTSEARRAAEEHLREIQSTLEDREKRINVKYTERMKAQIERLRALSAAVDAYVASLTKMDDKGKSLLASLINGEWLVRNVLGPKLGLPPSSATYVLYAKVNKAGGNTKVTKNLWTLFSGSRVRYSGGAIVSYILFGPDGTVCLANTHYHQTGYGQFKGPDQDFPGASF